MITYEWVVETLEGELEDVVDMNHFDAFAPALKYAGQLMADGKVIDIGLVRDRWNDEDGDLDNRQWAYLEDGKMPRIFDGGARVPAKYLDQWAVAMGAK